MQNTWTKLYRRVVMGCTTVLFGIAGIVGMFVFMSQGTETPIPEDSITPKFVDISGGTYHTLALDELGRVWAWGLNDRGQLGDDTMTRRTVPTLIPNDIRFIGRQITAIAVGYYHSIALDTQGCVWAWGMNSYGQLGNGTTPQKNVPTLISNGTRFNGRAITAIAATTYHNMAIDDQGSVWAWGYNYYGQLGDDTTEDKNVPTLISNGTRFNGRAITAIAASDYHSMAIDDKGSVWAWGLNDRGQLGDDTTVDKNAPTLINDTMFNGRAITAIAAGDYHSMALDDQDCVWAWGFNGHGQLGDDTTTQRDTPTLIYDGAMFYGRAITAIAADGFHSMAIDAQGSVWVWGNNQYGQFGNGTTGLAFNKSVPTLISNGTRFNGRAITAIAAGYRHSMAIDAQGSVWAWGYNVDGQLGDGTTTQRNTSVLIVEATIPPVTVTFATNEGSSVAPIKIPNDATDLTEYKPADPVRTYYRFEGWYKDEELTELFDFETERVPESDITLWARWVEEEYVIVKFVTNTDEDGINSEKIYEWTNMANVPKRDPVRKGYIFDGWFKDSGLTQIFDFNTETAPSSDITVYAGWTAKTYTVIYNFNGGTHESLSDTVTFGKTFTLAVPKMDNHNFDGWFTADGRQLTNSAGRSDTLTWDTDTNNYDLYARWVKAKYDMRFDYNDGILWTVVTSAYDELIPTDFIPAAPTREFATFQGWYTAEGIKFDFETMRMPANGISLSARWAVDVTRLKSLVTELNGYLTFNGFDERSYGIFLDAMRDATSVVVSSDLQTIDKVKKAHDDLLAAAIALTIADFTGKVTPPAEFNLPKAENNIWIIIVVGIAALAIGMSVTLLATRKRKEV